MDAKTIMTALKEKAADVDGLEVHDWPFEEAPEGSPRASFFYVETEDHRRFSVRVEEFYAFQTGTAIF